MEDEQRERMHFAVQAARIGIWELNLSDNTLVWDGICRELYGLTKNEILSYDQVSRFIYPKDLANVDKAVNMALAGHNGGQYDMRYRTIGADDAKLRWVHFKGQVIFNELAKPVRFAGIAQDISDAMQTILAARRAEQEAKQALEESELFSQNVFFNSPVAKIVFEGHDMVIRLVNENMLTMLGRDASILGQSFTEAIPELAGTPVLQRLRRVLETGETFEAPEEKIELARFGSPHSGYYHYIYKALIDRLGQRYGVMVTATEVTRQVIDRQRIEAARDQLHSAVEVAELGTWQIDVAKKTLEYSDRLREWSGIGPLEVIDAERAYATIADADRPRVQAAIARALAPGTDGVYDVEYRMDAGPGARIRIVRSRGVTHFNEQGIPFRIVGTVQDVTRQRQQQLMLEQEIQHRTEALDASNEELQAANEELATTIEELGELNTALIRSNDDLQQFAHVTSHDLKEPMRKIKMFLNRTVEDTKSLLSEKSRQYLQKADKAADRMVAMINGVLTYSKINAEAREVDKVELQSTLNDIAQDLEVLVDQKKATLTYANLPVIEGASILLYQLFYNLVINALKFSRPGVDCMISVSSNSLFVHDKPFVRITLTDNGIGFNPLYAESIFDTFTRLNAKDSYEGTGLGLALCRKIVQRHGGTITATGVPGEGATFQVQLPLTQSKPIV